MGERGGWGEDGAGRGLHAAGLRGEEDGNSHDRNGQCMM